MNIGHRAARPARGAWSKGVAHSHVRGFSEEFTSATGEPPNGGSRRADGPCHHVAGARGSLGALDRLQLGWDDGRFVGLILILSYIFAAADQITHAQSPPKLPWRIEAQSTIPMMCRRTFAAR